MYKGLGELPNRKDRRFLQLRLDWAGGRGGVEEEGGARQGREREETTNKKTRIRNCKSNLLIVELLPDGRQALV